MFMRSLLMGALVALCVGASALGGERVASGSGPIAVTQEDRAVTHAEVGGRPPLDGRSLYQMSMSLEDQEGRALGLDHFRGHPVIISLFYASCPSACPLLIHDIQRIEGALSPEERAGLRVLLVSIDPEHDTPTALAAAAERYGIDAVRWRLTRADDARVRELAAVLGIKYRREPGGALGHTSRLTLLDQAGVPVEHLDGLAQPADAFISRIQALGAPAP